MACPPITNYIGLVCSLELDCINRLISMDFLSLLHIWLIVIIVIRQSCLVSLLHARGLCPLDSDLQFSRGLKQTVLRSFLGYSQRLCFSSTSGYSFSFTMERVLGE